MKHSSPFILLFTSLLLASLACNTIIQQPTVTEAPTQVPTQIPTQASTQLPTQVPDSNTFPISISVGGTHACALLNNGHAACWGDNSSGQLGDGTYTKHNTATEVIGLTDIVSISAGGSDTCAVTKNGQVKCWGYNYSGQLGNGTKTSSVKPLDVPGLINVTAISAGLDHTCAVLSNGNVKCWGKNLNGRVGDGSAKLFILSPVDVVGLGADITRVAAGDEHTCALSSTGNIKCWGRNVEGQLGIGQDTNRSNVPVDVVSIDGNAVALSTGFSSSCAVLKDGKAKCWGWIGFQELGNTPVTLDGLDENAKLIATGANHVCVVLESSEVKCMGENTEGQLGDGTTVDTQEFVTVQELPDEIIEIRASFDYTCVLTTTSEVLCWGDNTSGELGNGTTEDSSTPVKVIGINK